MRLAAGQRLGAFEIVGSIGADGMGEVWKAFDACLKRTVAVKVIRSETDCATLQRLRLEAEALARIRALCRCLILD